MRKAALIDTELKPKILQLGSPCIPTWSLPQQILSYHTEALFSSSSKVN